MFLDQSYFTGPLVIAQLGQPAVVEDLNTFIDLVEKEVLQAALGYDLYTAFLEGLEGSEEADQKWLDLLNGVEFTYRDGYKNRWIGFANSETKKSVLAGFVWAEYISAHAKHVTGSGLKQAESENSQTVNPAFAVSKVLYEGRQDIKVLHEFLAKDNATVYTQYSYNQINFEFFNSTNAFGI